MRVISFRNGKKIGESQEPYIVAELNSSHNGDINVAKQMVDAAKLCGCNCVKFQSWSAESLYCTEYYRNNPISQRVVKKLSLTEKDLLDLAHYCEDIDIDFSSTPYSFSEVDFLARQTNAPFIKIASMDINNIPFLKYIGNTGVPIVLSTGMATIEEVFDAVKAIESTGNKQICILHCVSVYPADSSIINLNNIHLLREEFPEYPIGYSDHTLGYEVATASIALGCPYIEKHFTLDNKKMGMDNNMATMPDEMEALVRACNNVYKALGLRERIVSDEENKQKLKMRRSIVAKRNIQSGDILNIDDLEAKRPGDGISPRLMGELIGKRAKQNIPTGYLIRWDYLE